MKMRIISFVGIMFGVLYLVFHAGFSIAGNSTPYVVKNGDTLWEISQKYYGNAYFWPYLWSLNAKVTGNPHLIYPGIKLLLREPTFATHTTETILEGQREAKSAFEIEEYTQPDNCIDCFLQELDLADFKQELAISSNF